MRSHETRPPSEEFMRELREGGQMGSLAAMTIDGAWDEIRRLRDAIDYVREDAETERQELLTQVAPRGGLIDAKGHWVYLLYGDQDDILYVGRSSNVFARIGTHLSNPERKAFTKRVGLIECDSYQHSKEVEGGLIRHHRPLWNIASVPREVPDAVG